MLNNTNGLQVSSYITKVNKYLHDFGDLSSKYSLTEYAKGFVLNKCSGLL